MPSEPCYNCSDSEATQTLAMANPRWSDRAWCHTAGNIVRVCLDCAYKEPRLDPKSGEKPYIALKRRVLNE